MRDVFIIGGGNQAQYVSDIVERMYSQNVGHLYKIVGIIDSVKNIGDYVYGYKVIGRQENIVELCKKYHVYCAVIAVGDNYSRYKISEEIKNLKTDFHFINAIHPSVTIGSNVKFGSGVVAMAGCIFNPGAVVGDFTFFATGAQIEHDCTIGDYASVSAGSVMGGHVKIGKYSAITLGCTIFDRIKIGDNTVIGSGSLVTKDIGDDILAYGNPAKFIRYRCLGEKFLK